MKICVPIKEKTMAQVLLKIAEAQKAKADLIEIWAGEIKNLDLGAIFVKSKIPLLFNVKGVDEQGSFAGTEMEKLAILLDCAKQGAKYCDLNWNTAENIIEQFLAKKGDTKLILSEHFWRNTPPLPALLNLVKNMQVKGADIIKIVCTPKNKKDLLTILRLAENLERKKIRHITIMMGELGQLTRIVVPQFYSGEFTFATLNETDKTAPGQLTVEEMKYLAEVFKAPKKF